MPVTPVTPVTAVADGAGEEAAGGVRRRVDGRRDRLYIGVGLTPDAHADNARARNGR